MIDKNELNSNVRKFPVFDPLDSTPVVEENEPYHLKLCFCPLCQKGMAVLAKERSRNVISWQYICRVIFYCLSVIHKKNGYFSLKYDVHWFIVDHWYLFSQLDQFRTNPNKWKKAILDAMIHCNLFESGKSTMNKTGVWKLRKYEAPWEIENNYNSEYTINTINTNSINTTTTLSNMDKEKLMSTDCSQDDCSYFFDTKEQKLALPSLSSVYKYTMNDTVTETIPLPTFSDNMLSESINIEDYNGFIQSLL